VIIQAYVLLTFVCGNSKEEQKEERNILFYFLKKDKKEIFSIYSSFMQ
jgi:hypothetical protein